MKEKICYEVDKLNQLLPDYELRRFAVEIETEDGDFTKNQYYLCRPEVKAIRMYKGVFWETVYIELEDGTKIKAESDNVNSKDRSIIRINSNNFISPKLNYDNGYIESTEKLRNWLLWQGITEDELKDIPNEIDSELELKNNPRLVDLRDKTIYCSL